MADGKKVEFTTIVNKDFGKMTVKLLEVSPDGRYHSATCEYPYCERKLNDKGEFESVKLTRKQTEQMLLKMALGN